MADVRSLLRNERASRRISHPHVSYTKSGQIRCTVCNLSLKSEVLWDGHSRSRNHIQNVQTTQKRQTVSNEPLSKKRKLEEDEEDTRKRSKAVDGVPEGFFGEDVQKDHEDQESSDFDVGSTTAIGEESREGRQAEPEQSEPSVLKPPDPDAPSVDEDEWAAFERAVAPLAQDRPPTDQYAAATISAAPMTVAEVAAQEDAAKRAKREEEAEDEKEDEERKMEDEFEIMEEMEERVRRLKEKREALRANMKPKDLPQGGLSDGEDKAVDEQGRSVEGSSRENTDDEAEFDDWGFR